MAEFSRDNTMRSDDAAASQCLVVERAGHMWRFQWDDKGESAMLDRVVDLAGHPDIGLDYFDAAVLCHCIARGVEGVMDETSSIPDDESSYVEIHGILYPRPRGKKGMTKQ